MRGTIAVALVSDARMRTLNMLQERKGKEQHLCLARGSLVLTRDGYKPIQEVNVVTNSMDAEQGLAGGAAVNVQTRSGSNVVHGSGFGPVGAAKAYRSRRWRIFVIRA